MTVRTKSLPYAERGKDYVTPAGYGVSIEPVPGFYRYKLRGGSIAGGVRIWLGELHEPWTGEQMDRGLRLQAEFNGEPIDIDRVWPGCAGDPITELQYQSFIARMAWAKNAAPDSAFAEPGRKYDPLSTNNPLPF